MARNGWRAEDAIIEIFKFGSGEELEPRRRQCLALNKDGLKRCGWRCPLLIKFERCEERSKLVKKFQASEAPDEPLNFETDVMRFIELACCHQGPGHVFKMENAAADWFKAHSHEVPRTSRRSTRSDSVRDNSPTTARSVGARSFSTASTESIKMRPYTKGRDEWQLRKAIEDDLEGREFYRGRVYITVSSDLPGYVKIGYTTLSLDDRFAFALKDCGIDLQRRYGSRVVPHAMRLERIVHEELAAYRYRFVHPCPFCIDRPGKRHQEFFGTTVEYARGVIEYWAGRLEEDMYEDGALSPTQRGELMRLATSEKIKERQMRFSPETPSSSSADVSHGLLTPPQSPSPPVRESYREIAKPPTMHTRATHDRKVQSRATETPPSPPASPPSPRRASTSSEDSVNIRSQRKPLERGDRVSATYRGYGGHTPYGGDEPYGGYASYGGYEPYAGNETYRGNGSFGGYTSNSQSVNSVEKPKKGKVRRFLETLKLRRKKSF